MEDQDIEIEWEVDFNRGAMLVEPGELDHCETEDQVKEYVSRMAEEDACPSVYVSSESLEEVVECWRNRKDQAS